MNDDSLAHEVHIAPTAFGERKAANVALASQALNEELVDDMIEKKFPPAVQDLIRRLLDGTEPLDREQKYYEVNKFGPQHINMTVLRAAGFKPGEIAQALGVTNSHVAVTLNHPYAKKLIAALVPQNSARVLDIRTRMEVYASALLDQMFDLTSQSEDIELVGKIGFGILDRCGHGPVSKGVSVNVPASAFGAGAGGSGGDEKVMGRLASALEESVRLDKELMPTWRPSRPPEDGALPAGSETGLGDSRKDREAELRVPSEAPTSSAEAAD